jgi:L-ascorbate metabolism protein UlaG (beta-lactamase superfamily)
MAKNVMTPEVNSTHDHTSHCDTNVALQLRRTPSGNDNFPEITFARIAKTKGKYHGDWKYNDV